MTATPFQIKIPDAALADLRERLKRTRWPSEIPGSGWTYGTNKAYLQELCAYRADEFDWRKPATSKQAKTIHSMGSCAASKAASNA